MHLRFSCFQCGTGHLEHPVTVEVKDAPVYKLTCPVGHQWVAHLSNPKFEILFEMGLLAFSDGYTREAVATFAASAEEFVRLFINFILMKHEVEPNTRWSEMKPFWKLVNRAEPQLGAFAALYMIEKGCAPPYPDGKTTEFRNAVIHRGKIPTASEVVTYGEKLLSFIVPIYTEYKDDTSFMLAGSYAYLEHLLSTREFAQASSGYYCAIRHVVDSRGTADFHAAVEFARSKSFLQSSASSGPDAILPDMARERPSVLPHAAAEEVGEPLEEAASGPDEHS